MLSKTFKTGFLEMPILGIGTYQLRGSACYQSLNFALSLGYKHIDCSPSYLNEHMVSISLSRVPRSSVFLTSKLSYGFYDPASALTSLNKSLGLLKTDYLDMFMLEWPNPKQSAFDPSDASSKRTEIWNTLLSFKKSGIVKHVGVCNFTIEQLLSMYKSTQVWPELLSIELHPLNYNEKIIEFCKERDIQVVAHTPLCRGNRVLLDNLDLVTVAKRNGVSCSQVALRWLITKGVGVVVRSSNYEHIRNNTMLDFELSPEDIEVIDRMNKNMEANQQAESLRY